MHVFLVPFKMQPITLGFYKAFLPELRERLNTYGATTRWRGVQRFEVRDVRIRPAIDPLGEWVAVVTVDITAVLTAYDDELAELEDFTFSYGLHKMRAINVQQRGPSQNIRKALNAFELHWAWRMPIIAWMEDLLPSLRRRVAVLSDKWKEEIAAKIWSPETLAKRLEQGGWDLVEAIC
jgi:hypothetical protein